MSHACHRFWKNTRKPARFAHSWQGAQSLAPATWNDIWTSKSAPNLVCFVHLDLEMCFAPQQRTLFRHLNFQKCSDPGVVCTFWLGNALRATTACTFSTSQLPKVVWDRQFLHFWLRNVFCGTTELFISHLARWLRTRRFSEPTFRPSGATNHWKKHSVAPLCYLFAHLHLHRLSSGFFFSLVSDLHFSSLLFPESSHLCFFHLSVVGSLTSKPPSLIYLYIYIYIL